MTVKTHTFAQTTVAEILSDQTIISTTEDGLDLLGNLYYQGFDRMIVHEVNISPEFFDLKTKIAGEILQKFSNYRMRLAIVGNFDYPGNSLRDFIRESNQGRLVNFLPTLAEALDRLSNG